MATETEKMYPGMTVIERNTFEFVLCPTCSRMHQATEKGDKQNDLLVEVPTRCARPTCRCPMTVEGGRDYIQAQAIKEHDQAITEAGKKLRGEYQMPALDIEALRAEIRATIMAEMDIPALVQEAVQAMAKPPRPPRPPRKPGAEE